MTRVAPPSADLHRDALDALGPDDGDAFLTRLALWWPDLHGATVGVFGESGDVLAAHLAEVALRIASARSTRLRRLDRRREIDPGWFQRPDMVGYVAYTDRFAGTLDGVRSRLAYLEELGVTYLHLMPLLKPREGANDGGYAVSDFDSVDPRLGTMDDLDALATALHERDMSLCVDVVINHTAREHIWADKMRAGDPEYAGFYRLFEDRAEPDHYEQTLREIFPDTAPGSFTFETELDAWVWTTFHDYQWDLNYDNPKVLVAMIEVIGRLANRGVDVFRLDAVPFVWKRLGTDCENQPEAHLILQAFRAVMGIAAPGVILKAEAIGAPDNLVQYLGAHDDVNRRECDLAYHNLLMAMLWSSLATRETTLMTAALVRMRQAPPWTAWVTYVRCHDDIGWAVTPEDAGAVGVNAFAHRDFLNSFYAGDFEGSWARGARFQENRVTGDARISGSAASLCGLEAAIDIGDQAAIDAGVRRLLLLYAIVYSYGGIPLLYMGDELALRNDHTYKSDPALADDNRWMHRPRMDWDAAKDRRDPGSVESRVFGGLRRLAKARASIPAFDAGAAPRPIWTDDTGVFGFVRRHPRSTPVMVLANFADETRTVDVGLFAANGIADPVSLASSDGPLRITGGRVVLPSLGWVWVGIGDKVAGAADVRS